MGAECSVTSVTHPYSPGVCVPSQRGAVPREQQPALLQEVTKDEISFLKKQNMLQPARVNSVVLQGPANSK